MGLITRAMGLVFGGDDVIAQTAHIFRENAEAAAQRGHDLQATTLEQFGAEFRARRRSWFDRLIDGLNRLPRPMMALGTLGLLGAAMVDPIWFASRMQGIALVPEPLWWLLGAIVSFYFGARHQAKGQEFRRSIAETMATAGTVTGNIRALQALEEGAGAEATPRSQAPESDNPALDEWRTRRG